MKTIQKAFFVLVALLSLASCETNEEMISYGYTTFGGVTILWQADNTINYSFTFDGDSIDERERFPLPKDRITGVLRAFKNEETEPELEEAVAIDGNIIELIQMPNTPIAIVSGSDEADPSDRNKVKVRLFYNNVEGWGSSVKVDMYATADRTNYESVGQVVLTEGKLSDYFELDLNRFYREDPTQTRIYFNSDITDLDTGKLLQDHSVTYRQGMISIPSVSVGESGLESTYKFLTNQPQVLSSFTRFNYIYNISKTWE